MLREMQNCILNSDFSHLKSQFGTVGPHGGMKHGRLTACFKTTVQDSDVAHYYNYKRVAIKKAAAYSILLL